MHGLREDGRRRAVRVARDRKEAGRVTSGPPGWTTGAVAAKEEAVWLRARRARLVRSVPRARSWKRAAQRREAETGGTGRPASAAEQSASTWTGSAPPA